MLRKKSLTKEQVFQKLKHFCAYQDRCRSEVKTKAWSLGLKKTDVDELLHRLAEDKYLDEERFAARFVAGKFSLKQWGRVKIKSELRSRGISNYQVLQAMEIINEEKYTAALKKLAMNKWNSIKGKGVNHFVKMTRTRDFLMQRGFEPALISMELKLLMEKEKAPVESSSS
jgi:regulatory protein